jgi:hypothetical protein
MSFISDVSARKGVLIPTSKCHFLRLGGGSGSFSTLATDSQPSKPLELGISGGGSEETTGPISSAPALRAALSAGASKVSYVVTNAAGVAYRDEKNKLRTYVATKPSYAASKAFYAWLRGQPEQLSWKSGSNVSAPKELLSHLENLQRAGKIHEEHTRDFLARLHQLKSDEIETGIEIFIVRSGSTKPRRYVCHQHINVRPNEHQVKAKIVMETRAAPMPHEKPEEVSRLLRPFER